VHFKKLLRKQASKLLILVFTLMLAVAAFPIIACTAVPQLLAKSVRWRHRWSFNRVLAQLAARGLVGFEFDNMNCNSTITVDDWRWSELSTIRTSDRLVPARCLSTPVAECPTPNEGPEITTFVNVPRPSHGVDLKVDAIAIADFPPAYPGLRT